VRLKIVSGFEFAEYNCNDEASDANNNCTLPIEGRDWRQEA